jgi:endonuclease/exonuclease/phosphatase family metal-dependent hydrolase
MHFNVLNWNIGGAKVLEQKTRKKREETRAKINVELERILSHRPQGVAVPDVITLQEVVQYREPSDPMPIDLVDRAMFAGYRYYPLMLFDSKLLSSKAKWNKIKKDSDWHPDTFFAQGNGYLIKNDVRHFPVWDLAKLNQNPVSADHFIEQVHLESGLYFGDRNTEPRAALVAHFIVNPDATGRSKKPLDIFVVNIHLTTLMMEREGVPEIDTQASRIRMGQLDVVFNGIVSRYNSWRTGGYRDRGERRDPDARETFVRHSPVWIIAGDFNFTETSAEYEFIRRMNFVDTIPDAGKKDTQGGQGTKASGAGKKPTLTLDYVFAGPQFVSLDPAIAVEFTKNSVIREGVLASDHYPLSSSINLIPQQ